MSAFWWVLAGVNIVTFLHHVSERRPGWAAVSVGSLALCVLLAVNS